MSRNCGAGQDERRRKTSAEIGFTDHIKKYAPINNCLTSHGGAARTSSAHRLVEVARPPVNVRSSHPGTLQLKYNDSAYISCSYTAAKMLPLVLEAFGCRYYSQRSLLSKASWKLAAMQPWNANVSERPLSLPDSRLHASKPQSMVKYSALLRLATVRVRQCQHCQRLQQHSTLHHDARHRETTLLSAAFTA